jgi:hypothetical protein
LQAASVRLAIEWIIEIAVPLAIASRSQFGDYGKAQQGAPLQRIVAIKLVAPRIPGFGIRRFAEPNYSPAIFFATRLKGDVRRLISGEPNTCQWIFRPSRGGSKHIGYNEHACKF